ncbi:MAG: SgcQ protein, partial [Crenarchaeota archaeon]|nr:SgcQ protein [Thermoproteota archaeon]
MNKVNALVNIVKPVIGLVHLPPLPGTYLNDGSLSLESILQTALEDARNLAEGKIDAMLICNENDKPYTKKAEPHIIAQMTWIAEKIVDEVDLPFGIDVQWDPFASLAIAKATDAAFIRGLVVGTYCGDLGQYSIDPCQFAEYRKKIGAQNVKVFTNLMPEFSYSLDQRPIALRALT